MLATYDEARIFRSTVPLVKLEGVLLLSCHQWPTPGSVMCAACRLCSTKGLRQWAMQYLGSMHPS